MPVAVMRTGEERINTCRERRLLFLPLRGVHDVIFDAADELVGAEILASFDQTAEPDSVGGDLVAVLELVAQRQRIDGGHGGQEGVRPGPADRGFVDLLECFSLFGHEIPRCGEL